MKNIIGFLTSLSVISLCLLTSCNEEHDSLVFGDKSAEKQVGPIAPGYQQIDNVEDATRILLEADVRVQHDYLEEICRKEVVREPLIAAKVMQSLLAELGEKTIGGYARTVVALNKDYLQPEAHDQFVKENRAAYNILYALGWTRHGVEK